MKMICLKACLSRSKIECWSCGMFATLSFPPAVTGTAGGIDVTVY